MSYPFPDCRIITIVQNRLLLSQHVPAVASRRTLKHFGQRASTSYCMSWRSFRCPWIVVTFASRTPPSLVGSELVACCCHGTESNDTAPSTRYAGIPQVWRDITISLTHKICAKHMADSDFNHCGTLSEPSSLSDHPCRHRRVRTLVHEKHEAELGKNGKPPTIAKFLPVGDLASSQGVHPAVKKKLLREQLSNCLATS